MTALAEAAASPAAGPSRPTRRGRWPIASIATVATALLLWQLSSTFAWVSPVFLPPPAKVVAAIGRLVTQGYVELDAGAACTR